MCMAMRLVVLVAAFMMGAGAANAKEDQRLAIAIGQPGSESFAFGTELWAMGQIALMPAHRIVLQSKEVVAEQDRLSLLQKREVEAALIHGLVPEGYGDDVRAIMALWPHGQREENARPVQILVHKDVEADTIYLVTKAMFENANFFRSSHARLGIGLPSAAIQGLDVPIHEGAFRYYDEVGFGLEASVVAAKGVGGKPAINVAKQLKTATYRNFDDAALESNEVDQIAAACRQAFEMGALLNVLGDLDHTGCEVYQDKLLNSDSQPSRVAATPAHSAASEKDTTASLFEADSPVGQGGPAIRWVPMSGDAAAVPPASAKPSPTGMSRQPTM